MTARPATARTSGVPAWEVVVGVPDLAVVAQRAAAHGAGTCTWGADATELHVTDPHGLVLAVVPA